MDDEKNLIIRRDLEGGTQILNKSIAKVKEIAAGLYQDYWQTVFRQLRQSPALVDLMKKVAKDKDYKVVIPPKFLDKLKDGSARLGRRPSGLLSVTIHDNKTGKLIKQVSLKEVASDLTPSLNQLAIQNVLANVSRRLEIMDQKLDDILEGQHNDRIAFVYSGVAIFQQAMAAKRKGTRRHLLFSAIQELNYGCQSLMRELEANVSFFEADDQESALFNIQFPLKKNVSTLRTKALQVQKAFQGVIQASYVLAWIYSALDEPDSTIAALLPVEETVKEFGQKGYQISRWLPESEDKVPEQLWNEYLQLANEAVEASKQLEAVPLKKLEFGFTPDELLKGD